MEQENANNFLREPIPNATAALVLGIVSIPTCCCCFGIVGLITSIIGLVLANGAISKYNEEPDRYSEGSLKNAKAGRVCAIVGLVLSVLWALMYVVLFATGTLSELESEQQRMLEDILREFDV